MTDRIDPAIRLTKVCPDCGSSLVIRTNRMTGVEFIACSSWPQCTHTEPIPETLRMQLAGAPTLFDEPDPVPGLDRRPVERCPHCGASIVWGRETNGMRAPFDVVSMKATGVNHMTTCKQIQGWSKPHANR